MITENLSTLKIHKLTQAQYNREFENGTLDENALYLTPDEEMDLSGYATTEQLNEKANVSHEHSISNITNLQTSLDSKASSEHTHKYAASSSAGGAATSANKLNTDAGSATQPVYFVNGVPTATTYTLSKSVPSDAKFTDTNTHYESKNVVGATNATSNTTAALSNGAVYINSVENGVITSSHKISGSGATTVTTDTSGNVIISSTNTTYDAAGSSLGLVKTGGDVTISSGVITVNDDSHNHTIANVDNLQSSLDAKQATITGGATTITSSNLTSSRALVSDSSGKVAVSAVTSTELGYLDGVTSNVQTQLDGKSATSHTHSYAGSPSVGGAATSANKVNASLTVKLNGGTSEGTNLFTFNGSSAKNVNITPSSIGAATSSHTHDDKYYTETEIDSKLSGKANSSHGNHVPTTQTASNNTFLRNDNTWATVTPANIGAAASSHTHKVSNISDLTATATELNYMDGVTSNVQTQLDGKSNSSHTHSYAGSSSVGGSATSAVKLDTSTAGDASTPVYFSGGKPVACTSLDLNTSGSSASCTGNAATATNVAWSGITSKPSYYDAKAIKNITRSGTTFTYTCMDGTTGTFTQQDNNTTYSLVTTSANGLMSASDKTKFDAMELATLAEVQTYLGI